MSQTANNHDHCSQEFAATNQQDPPAQGRIGRALYAASYYISYGVTLPTLMIANLLPEDSVVWQGLHGGACDAAAAEDRFQARLLAAAGTARDKLGEAYAKAATGVAQRIETVQDVIAERKYRRRTATT